MNKYELIDKHNLWNLSKQEAVEILEKLKDNITEQIYVAYALASGHDISFKIHLDYLEDMRYGHNNPWDLSWNPSSANC